MKVPRLWAGGLKVIHPSEISIEQSSHDLGKKGERKKIPEFVQIRGFSFSPLSYLSRAKTVQSKFPRGESLSNHQPITLELSFFLTLKILSA